MNVFCDIETLPAQDPAVIADLRADMKAELDESLSAIRAPANYKDESKIAAYIDEKHEGLVAAHEAAVLAAYLKTGLDGGLGQVCVIGWATDDDVPLVANVNCGITERDLLGTFFADLASLYRPTNRMRFIGHNLIGFDLRFIWHRAMVLGIKPPPGFPRDPKPWDDTVFDTMLAWAGVRDRISLTKLCRILGVPDDDDIDGKDVWPLFQAGQIAKIAEHCRKDEQKVRAVYNRMTFSEAA
jgi:hypothetical protein